MSRRLPPLAALRVFEAAARHGSFTRAAAELGMTQAAVSYQIKVLEDRVGQALFTRRPRQVSLTEAGARLAPAVSDAFERLSAAWEEARHDARGTLVINTWQTFATIWLARRIGSFQVAHPGIAVRIETEQDPIDFARAEADVAIRFGDGEWPGLVVHELARSVYSPMLSPKLADSIGGLREPADLMRLPIVSPDDPWWARWLAVAGLSPALLAGRPTARLGSQVLEANAAIAGQGVAMLTTGFYQQEIEAGLLIQPFDIVGDEEKRFFLVYPQARRNSPKVRAFRDWILAEFEKTRAPAGDAA